MHGKQNDVEPLWLTSPCIILHPMLALSLRSTTSTLHPYRYLTACTLHCAHYFRKKALSASYRKL